ncbi:MAG: hypothetical protein AAGD13_00770 [Pseudomonadota bacterium]
MPRYLLKANCGWIAGSETDFGEHELDNEEDAMQAAWESAAEQIEAYAELIED